MDHDNNQGSIETNFVKCLTCYSYVTNKFVWCCECGHPLIKQLFEASEPKITILTDSPPIRRVLDDIEYEGLRDWQDLGTIAGNSNLQCQLCNKKTLVLFSNSMISDDNGEYCEDCCQIMKIDK
jgi:hypothetical protein